MGGTSCSTTRLSPGSRKSSAGLSPSTCPLDAPLALYARSSRSSGQQGRSCSTARCTLPSSSCSREVCSSRERSGRPSGGERAMALRRRAVYRWHCFRERDSRRGMLRAW